LRLQAGWLEEVERRHCSEIALNVMMSDPDARRLEALAPDARTVVIPNGVDVDYFRPTGTALRAGPVLFLGPTYMYPNRDAVEYFLAEIWPRVRQAVPNASLELVGKTPDALKPSFLAHPRVTCQGYVPDVRPHLAAAACSVVPIRIGGGTRLKILDSWAMGKAVVSTSVGCEGLRAVDGENIMIRDDAGGFADAVVRVLEDAALRDRLGAAGRRTAEKWYSWGTIGDQLIAAYRGLGI
jgi:glycosyltransferase involved in cell wall biosynthesis